MCVVDSDEGKWNLRTIGPARRLSSLITIAVARSKNIQPRTIANGNVQHSQISISSKMPLPTACLSTSYSTTWLAHFIAGYYYYLAQPAISTVSWVLKKP